MQTFKQYINEEDLEDESAETWGYKNALIQGNGLFWSFYRRLNNKLQLQFEDWFYYHYKNSNNNLDIIRNWLNTNHIFYSRIAGVWSNNFETVDQDYFKEPSNFLTEQEAKIVVELMMQFFQEEVI